MPEDDLVKLAVHQLKEIIPEIEENLISSSVMRTPVAYPVLPAKI